MLAACSVAGPASDPAETADSADAAVSTGDVVGFETGFIEIGGSTLFVAVADTTQLRSQGLRGVVDLGDLDGMLFVFDAPGPVWFTMQDTVIPLDLLVVSSESRLVARIAMVPCEATPCPLYPTGGDAAYAVEVAAGDFAEIGGGSRFSIKGVGQTADG